MAEGKRRKKHGEGSYALQMKDHTEIAFADFQNPWNFFNLMSSSDTKFYSWLRNNGLLAKQIDCHCGQTADIRIR